MLTAAGTSCLRSVPNRFLIGRTSLWFSGKAVSSSQDAWRNPVTRAQCAARKSDTSRRKRKTSPASRPGKGQKSASADRIGAPVALFPSKRGSGPLILRSVSHLTSGYRLSPPAKGLARVTAAGILNDHMQASACQRNVEPLFEFVARERSVLPAGYTGTRLPALPDVYTRTEIPVYSHAAWTLNRSSSAAKISSGFLRIERSNRA